MTERPQSPGEEIANSVSDGVALLAAIGALPFLIAAASRRSLTSYIGVVIFAATK